MQFHAIKQTVIVVIASFSVFMKRDLVLVHLHDTYKGKNALSSLWNLYNCGCPQTLHPMPNWGVTVVLQPVRLCASQHENRHVSFGANLAEVALSGAAGGVWNLCQHCESQGELYKGWYDDVNCFFDRPLLMNTESCRLVATYWNVDTLSMCVLVPLL